MIDLCRGGADRLSVFISFEGGARVWQPQDGVMKVARVMRFRAAVTLTRIRAAVMR